MSIEKSDSQMYNTPVSDEERIYVATSELLNLVRDLSMNLLKILFKSYFSWEKRVLQLTSWLHTTRNQTSNFQILRC